MDGHIRSRRLDLKLLQRQAADQIGVDEATITNWEFYTSLPSVLYILTIIQFLSLDPLPPECSDRYDFDYSRVR